MSNADKKIPLMFCMICWHSFNKINWELKYAYGDGNIKLGLTDTPIEVKLYHNIQENLNGGRWKLSNLKLQILKNENYSSNN